MVTPPAPVSSRKWKSPRPLTRTATKTRLSTRSKGRVKEVLESARAGQQAEVADENTQAEKTTMAANSREPRMTEFPPWGATSFQIRQNPNRNHKQQKHPSSADDTPVIQFAVWKFPMKLHQNLPVMPPSLFLELVPAHYRERNRIVRWASGV